MAPDAESIRKHVDAVEEQNPVEIIDAVGEDF